MKRPSKTTVSQSLSSSMLLDSKLAPYPRLRKGLYEDYKQQKLLSGMKINSDTSFKYQKTNSSLGTSNKNTSLGKTKIAKSIHSYQTELDTKAYSGKYEGKPIKHRDDNYIDKLYRAHNIDGESYRLQEKPASINYYAKQQQGTNRDHMRLGQKYQSEERQLIKPIHYSKSPGRIVSVRNRDSEGQQNRRLRQKMYYNDIRVKQGSYSKYDNRLENPKDIYKRLEEYQKYYNFRSHQAGTEKQLDITSNQYGKQLKNAFEQLRRIDNCLSKRNDSYSNLKLDGRVEKYYSDVQNSNQIKHYKEYQNINPTDKYRQSKQNISKIEKQTTIHKGLFDDFGYPSQSHQKRLKRLQQYQSQLGDYPIKVRSKSTNNIKVYHNGSSSYLNTEGRPGQPTISVDQGHILKLKNQNKYQRDIKQTSKSNLFSRKQQPSYGSCKSSFIKETSFLKAPNDFLSPSQSQCLDRINALNSRINAKIGSLISPY